MSTPTAKPDESAIDAAGRPAPGKVLGAVVDAIGAAHMTAGLMLALAIAGGLALGLGDAWGGALFLTGGVPASLASAVEAMRNEPWTDSGASLRGIGSMVRYAQANRDYFARMMVAQLLAAGVNVALGYALRR